MISYCGLRFTVCRDGYSRSGMCSNDFVVIFMVLNTIKLPGFFIYAALDAVKFGP